MGFARNIGAYPAKTNESTAGWPRNIGADPSDLTGAGAPVWGARPIIRSFVNGKTLEYDVACTGSATITYQWYKNGVTMGASYQDRVLTIAGASATDGGTYYCIATNSVDSSQMLPVYLSVRTDTYNVLWSRNIGASQRHDIPASSMARNIGASQRNENEATPGDPIDVSATVGIDLGMTATASTVTAVSVTATVGMDLGIVAEVGGIAPVDVSATVGMDLQIVAEAYKVTEVTGTAIRDNKRLIAISNDELWYEDI